MEAVQTSEVRWYKSRQSSGAAAADAAEEDFNNRAKGGIPDDIPDLQLSGAPLGISASISSVTVTLAPTRPTTRV